MKWAHLKFVITAVAAASCFVIAAIVTVQMLWFDSELSEHAQKFHSGAKRLEVSRAFRHETYSDLPVILFLASGALILGILAIRFYNHAKSEFGR
jgi:hypothetical protein